MRIAILAPGSRGDVQPYLALGDGLKAAGHEVRLVTTRDHDALVRAHGLELFSVPVDVQAALQGGSTAEVLEGGGVVRSFRELSRLAVAAARLLAEVSLEASRGVDVVVTGFGGVFMGEAVARRLGVPLVQAYNVALTPTGAYAGALLPGLDFGARSRRLGHWLTRQAVWLTARQAGEAARREVLGVPPSPRLVSSRFAGLVEGPVLYGFSEAFLPRGPEWGADVEVTGFWFTDGPPDFTPPPALVDFLAGGPKPVCIGFGSMSQRDPKGTTALVLAAVKRAGVRAVLLAGWGGLRASELPAEVFALDSIPHAWLYPRCAAVVHHGGAGTTAAALRAGVPAVVVPFHGDQPFWGKRVHSMGAGPRPIPRRALTVDGLATALREAATSAELAERAARLGESIRAERGVERAVASIARLAAPPTRR